MAFPSSITDIIATTIESRTGKIQDNVTKNNALLTWLKKKGKAKTVTGGSSIFQEFSFQENGNFGWYSGYDLLPVAAQDVISGATFTLKQAAVPVVVSGLELLQNSSKEAVIDLLESRLAVAEGTMANQISAGIYGDGTGSGGKTITGIGALLNTDPAGTATPYGGINGATWSFWRNRFLKANLGSQVFGSNVALPWMNKMYAATVRGSDHVDLVVGGQAAWADYQASLQNILRATSTASADMGFPTMQFMQADFVLDGGIGGYANSIYMYFLNTNYLHWRPHKDRNMVPLTPGRRVSINQDAEVQILAWAGNLTCSGRQFQGLLAADNTGTAYTP